jgi:hypothetical protein
MGSIPNGSAPLQACARQIFKFYASGPHWEGASFPDALLSGRENPSTPGADLRACILPPMWLCRSCTSIVSSLRDCFVSVMRMPVSHLKE